MACGRRTYRMVLSVRRRIHCGIGRFWRCFFARIFFTLNDLWDGYTHDNDDEDDEQCRQRDDKHPNSKRLSEQWRWRRSAMMADGWHELTHTICKSSKTGECVHTTKGLR